MTAPDMAESVGGVDELSDTELDAIVARLTPAKRTDWKARAILAERGERFWRLASLFLAIVLALTVAALAVAVST